MRPAVVTRTLTQAVLVCVVVLNPLSSVAAPLGSAPIGCPFQNPLYKDIRAAANTLADKVRELPDQCKMQKENLQAVNDNISGLIEQLYKLVNGQNPDDTTTPAAKSAVSMKEAKDNTTTPEKKDKGQELVAKILASLQTLTSAYTNYAQMNNDCGRAVLTKADYVGAAADIAQGLAPFLGIFGGPIGSTVSQGVKIVGSAVKNFIKLFTQSKLSMAKREERELFLQNACSLWQLNQNVAYLLQLQLDKKFDVSNEVNELKKRIENLAKTQPLEAKPEAHILSFADQQAFDLKELASIEKFKLDYGQDPNTQKLLCTYVAETMKKSVERKTFPAGAFERLAFMLDEDEQAEITTTGPRLILNKAKEFKPEDFAETAPDCNQKVDSWLKLVKAVMAMSDTELKRGGRLDLSCLASNSVRQSAQAQMAELQEALARAEARNAYLKGLSGPGEEFEVGALFEAQDEITRQIFGVHRMPKLFGLIQLGGKNSPTEAWLEHVWRYAEVNLKLYFDNRDQALKIAESFKPGDEKIEVDTQQCGLMIATARQWTAAERQARMAKTYCSSFADVIMGGKYDPIMLSCYSEKGKDNKVVSQLKRVRAEAKDYLKILKWIKSSGCLRKATAGANVGGEAGPLPGGPLPEDGGSDGTIADPTAPQGLLQIAPNLEQAERLELAKRNGWVGRCRNGEAGLQEKIGPAP